MQTVKTTVNLSQKIFSRLKNFTGRNRTYTMSQVLELGATMVMDDAEKGRVKRIHEQLADLNGIGTSRTPKLAQMSVDEIAYGLVSNDNE